MHRGRVAVDLEAPRRNALRRRFPGNILDRGKKKKKRKRPITKARIERDRRVAIGKW